MWEVWSIVVVVAVASGLDFFVLLVTLGALSALDPDHALANAGLAAPLLLLPALAGVGLEASLERRSGADLVWRQVQALVRPIGAVSLTLLLLPPASTSLTGGAVLAVLAGSLALLAHVGRSGWALLVRLRDDAHTLRRGLRLEDLGVVLLALCLWWARPIALIGACAVAIGYLRRLGVLIPAFRLSSRLVRGSLRSLVLESGWRSPVHFPEWIKKRLSPSGVVTGGRLRGTPVASIAPPPEGGVQFGWLVVRGAQPVFAHRTRDGIVTTSLLPGVQSRIARGPLCLCLRIADANADELLLVLPGDGPNPSRLRAELT